MSLHPKANPGDRVAHATIDSKTGLARTGIVEDVIKDSEGNLIAARWDDDPTHVEAFDEREIIPLRGPTGKGPVLLHLRHYGALLKRPSSAVALILALVASVVFGVISQAHEWSADITVLTGVIMIVVCLGIFATIEKVRRKKK